MINKPKKLGIVFAYTILCIISFVMIYPFLWMIFGSFKSNFDIINNPLSILPKKWTLDGWKKILILSGNPLSHYFINSIKISFGTTFIVVLATSLGSFTLYRKKDLPFFKIIESLFSVSLMYPAVLLLIPLYVLVIKMGLYGVGNFWGIIFASSTGAWGAALPFFLFRQFFQTVPYELIEAGTIDGAGEATIFFRLMVPIMAPVFLTSTLISFLSSWGLWLPVVMLSQDMSTYNLAAMLVNLNSDLGVDLSMTAALSTVITLPVVIVFLFTQKKVLEGIVAGSVKG
jgi:ABC-type glycerol-3-phosphate transport system permease component